MHHKSVLPDAIRRVVLAFLEDVDTPRSLTVKLLIEHGEVEQLLSLTTPPARYSNASDYFKDNAVTELLRKCKSVGSPELRLGRRARAVESFYTSEKACKATNDRMSLHLYNGPFEDPRDLRVSGYLSEAREYIRLVLGTLPSQVRPRHGPGATYHDRGVRTTVPDKMSTRPTVTAEARCLLDSWAETSWFRGLAADAPHRTDPETIRGNRFTTVDKDALKDRGICIEPSINIFFQLGMGKLIRGRLSRIGIDLDNGQPTHQQVAREASVTGRYATVDLSNASDTVCRNLVKLLLPDLWHEALTTLRSPFTKVDGKDVYLEKFSSMGNGFTFELETLIFLSLAVVATRHAGIEPLPGLNIFVYGDDIIVPSEASRNLLALLRYCGFTPNERKTFTSGWFRESCGGDYFRGEPVRAYYLEEFPDDITAWIGLANGLRRLAGYYDQHSGGLHFTQRAWFRVLDNLPSRIRRLRGPIELGDTVLHDSADTWNVERRFGRRYVLAMKPKFHRISLKRWGGAGLQLACMLYGTGASIVPRGPVESYGISWTEVPCSTPRNRAVEQGIERFLGRTDLLS